MSPSGDCYCALCSRNEILGVSSLQFCARRGLGQATLVLLLDKETVRKFERLSPGSSGCPVEGRWLVGRASPLSTLSELCPHFYTGISSCTRLLDGLAFCAIIGGFQNKVPNYIACSALGCTYMPSLLAKPGPCAWSGVACVSS